jgi:hypothetical protein
LPAFRPSPTDAAPLLSANTTQKRHLLESGFYGKWSSAWHENFLSAKVAHNFAILDTDDTATYGHQEKRLILINEPGYGLAKNALIKQTGLQVFAVTTHTPSALVSEISKAITLSPVERARFLLEFDVDAAQVLNGLVAKDMPVYGQIAA